MTDDEQRADYIESFRFSLDGALSEFAPACLRAYSFQVDVAQRIVTVKAEFGREPDEDEAEDLSVASTNVVSDQIMETREGLMMIDQIDVVTPFGTPLDPLPDGIGFLRKGEQPPVGYAGVLPLPIEDSRAHRYPHYRTGKIETG